jgi:hypothetical protein
MVERELMTIVSRLLVETALEGVMVGASDEVLAATAGRKQQEEVLVSQLGDMKAMVRQIKQKHSHSQAQNPKDRTADRRQQKPVDEARPPPAHPVQQQQLRSSQSTGVISAEVLQTALGSGVGERPMTDGLSDGSRDGTAADSLAVTSAGTGAIEEQLWHTDAAASEPSQAAAPVGGASGDRPSSAGRPSKRSPGKGKPVAAAAAAVAARGSSEAEAAGIMAQLFLQVHQSQEGEWTRLSDSSARLYAEVVGDRRRILSELRAQNSEALAEEITSAIHVVEGDDAETELYVEETIHKLHSIMSSHREMLALLNQQLEMTHAKYGTSAQERCGGWKREDHDVFVKILKRAELAGTARKLIVEQFRQQLAHLSLDTVAMHEEWYREIKLTQARKHELIQSHEQSLVELVQSAKADLAAFREQRSDERRQDLEYRRFEERRQDLHILLAQQRAEKDVKDAIAAQKLAELEREQMDSHIAAVEKARRRALEMQAQVNEFRALKAAEAAVEAERRRVEAEARAQELKAQVESNRENVEQRGEAYWQKEEAKRLKMEEMQQREIRRRELLAKIAEQVRCCWFFMSSVDGVYVVMHYTCCILLYCVASVPYRLSYSAHIGRICRTWNRN